MKRYKCKIAYDGTNFAGYQIQPNKRTVQGEIEKALAKMHKGTYIKTFASGRTDAGVHARGQVIHFDSPLSIPEEKWGVALNSLLPDDISVVQVNETDKNFHARFSATGKEYRYFVYLSQTRDPFKRLYACRYSYPLDFGRMEEAASYLVGIHDFTSFCSAKTEIEDKVRELRKIEMMKDGEDLVFRFVGDGFLYNMVRILVGTLLQTGSGEFQPADMKVILEKRDRSFAGKTAPSQGLFLWEVFYD